MEMYDFQFFGKGKQLADLALRTRPCVVVGGLRIHHSGNEQHRCPNPRVSRCAARYASRRGIFPPPSGSSDESGYSQWSMFITESIRIFAAVAAFLISSACMLVGRGRGLNNFEADVACQLEAISVAELSPGSMLSTKPFFEGKGAGGSAATWLEARTAIAAAMRDRQSPQPAAHSGRHGRF